MSEAQDIESFHILFEELKDIRAKLSSVSERIGSRLRDNAQWDSTYQVSLLQESINIRKTIKQLYDNLLDNQLSDPSLVCILQIKHTIVKFVFFFFKLSTRLSIIYGTSSNHTRIHQRPSLKVLKS